MLKLKGLNFTVKGNDFQFDRVLHVLPNTHQSVKYFPNFILTRNKHNLKRKENRKTKKRSFFIVRFVYFNGLPIALTLKVSDKYNWCHLKMVKTKV